SFSRDWSSDVCSSDLSYLRTLWAQIQARLKTQAAPSLLYSDLTLPQRVLRDMAHPGTNSIIVDSRSTVSDMEKWAATYTPALLRSEERRVGQERSCRR